MDEMDLSTGVWLLCYRGEVATSKKSFPSLYSIELVQNIAYHFTSENIPAKTTLHTSHQTSQHYSYHTTRALPSSAILPSLPAHLISSHLPEFKFSPRNRISISSKKEKNTASLSSHQ